MALGNRREVFASSTAVVALLILALIAQYFFHGMQPKPVARAEDLPAPPAVSALQVAALGEYPAASRVLSLWLQAFDYQSGIALSFHDLDYTRVVAWLERALWLDPSSDYPLLAASRIYAEIDNPPKQRLMLDFVHRAFQEDPVRRWRWLAHGAIVAKHRLHDLDLALLYARAISELPQEPKGPEVNNVPSWARQMHIFILEEMGEVEQARLLIGGLLATDQIQDARERHFLVEKLVEMEKMGAIQSGE